eukprot:jgi/Ulvmu1/720/UM010_0092.1
MSLDLPQHPVVLLLIGLPGSGKSTFARWLNAHLTSSNTEVHHVEYDLVWRHYMHAHSVSYFNPQAWKSARTEAHKQVQQVAQDMSSRGVSGFIVVDDNMFYRSMRKQVFLLARQSRCAFVQLYLETQLADALASNETRPASTQVHASVIERMSGALQQPDEKRCPWEAATVAVEGPLRPERCECIGQDTLIQLSQFWHQRLQPAADAGQPQAQVSAAGSQGQAAGRSLHHELDLATRRVLQQICTGGRRPRPESIRRLNRIRRGMLAASRRLPHQELEASWLRTAADYASVAERYAAGCGSEQGCTQE